MTPPRALPYDLAGHVALVTGANRGIGAAGEPLVEGLPSTAGAALLF